MELLSWIPRFLASLVRPLVELSVWSFHGLAGLQTLDEDGEVNRPWWLTIVLLPWLVVRSAWQIVSYFFSGLFSAEAAESHERRLRFVCGLPFLIVLAAALMSIAIHVSTQSSLQIQYSRGMDQAESGGDIGLAHRFSERVMAVAQRRDPAALYTVSKLLERTDGIERANAIVDLLAPIDAKGYTLAHRQRALEAFRVLERTIDPVLLDQLFWHLSHADGDDNEQMLMIWVEYYLYVGDFLLASQKLELLATKDPKHWFTVAELAIARGDVDNAIYALTQAAEAYSGQLAQNPMSKEVRWLYAASMAKLGKIEPSLDTMQFGWELSNDKDFAKGISQLMILQFDRGFRKTPTDFAAMWKHLQNALRWDFENIDVYDRLVQLHQGTSDNALKSDILSAMHRITQEHPDFYKSYFSLSALELQADRLESASRLLNRAIELRPDSHAALNNLAWLLLQRSEREQKPELLSDAARLSQRSVELLPESGSYRDTLGTILLRQGKIQAGITELELALANVLNPLPVHEKLGWAYRQLGKLEIAESHERISVQQRSRTSLK